MLRIVIALLLVPAPLFAAPSVADVYRSAAPAVVLIVASDESGRVATGTGSLLTHDGVVLTNDHVVLDETTGKPWPRIIVFLKPAVLTGDVERDLDVGMPAGVQGREPTLDLAVLRIKGVVSGLPTLPVADGVPEVGESVLAIGHPHGGGVWTLTTGTLSAVRPNWNGKGLDALQTDAALNPGNSGGPLLDGEGRLVGVNKAVHREGPKGMAIDGIGFAIQAGAALRWVRSLGIEPRVVGRGAAAVGAASPRAEGGGAVASAPAPGSHGVSPQATPSVEARTSSAPQAATPTPVAPSGAVPAAVAPAAVAPAAPATRTGSAHAQATAPAPAPVAPAPAPRVASPSPAPAPAAAAPAASGQQPRAFSGPSGQAMYGVPSRVEDIMRLAPSLFERARLGADRAFDELERTQY